MWVTKLLISPVKKRFFAQKRPNLAQNWHFGRFGPNHAGLFGALLVGQLVVVAGGLYLARHLFTLLDIISIDIIIYNHILHMRVERCQCQWTPFSVLDGENLARKQTCSCCDHC